MNSPTLTAIHHARLLRSSTTNPATFNHLITLYSHSPATLPLSLRLFNHLPFKPTSISWTSIISAYSYHSPQTSLHLFFEMLWSRSLPNQGTISSLLKAFSSSFPLCLQLHSLSLKLSLSHQPFSGSSLICFYANNNLPDSARKVFDEIPHKDEVCYGAMVVGLARNGMPVEAINMMQTMLRGGVSSTVYSVSGALSAAAELAGLEVTRMVHCHAVVVGVERECGVGTGLVDAYGKAGFVLDARRVFDGMGDGLNVVTWNAMLGGYGQQGDADTAKRLFEEMRERRKFVPDKYTFLAVLTACSNAGLVDETERWLDLMDSEYGVKGRVEHCTCLVAAMARAGKLEEAEHLVFTMPVKPDAVVWRTLLVGCLVHNSVEMGQVVAKRLMKLDPKDDSAYVMLANIYSATGKKDDKGKVLGEMRDRGLRKEKGRSWIEVKGEVHEFVAGDMRHERRREIYNKLRELVKDVKTLGYEEEDEGVRYHSERLALAFGLVSGPTMEGKVLRVVKNLRACRDCHEFFKYVSKVTRREIVVRDVNRYHRFEDGDCSCQDYW